MKVNIELDSVDWSNIAMQLDKLAQQEIKEGHEDFEYTNWLLNMSHIIEHDNALAVDIAKGNKYIETYNSIDEVESNIKIMKSIQDEPNTLGVFKGKNNIYINPFFERMYQTEKDKFSIIFTADEAMKTNENGHFKED